MFTVTHAFNSTIFTPFAPVSWTQTGDTSFNVSNINSITYSGDKYVAVGDSGKLATSIDFITWTIRTSSFGTSKIFSVFYDAGQELYIATGSSGKLATSTDGINWTQRASGFGSAAITSITYSSLANLWIAVASDGKLGTSPDGIAWTLRTPPLGTTYTNKVFSNNNLIIVVGYDGKLATSTNATTWVLRTSGFSVDAIFDVVSNVDSRYVAVGELGKVTISENGTNWNIAFPFTSFGSSTIRSVAVAQVPDTAFVAAGASGKLATSFDGIYWDQRISSFGSSTINDLYVTDNLGLAVGNSGKIAYSI
jgi:hypothetical protein